MYLTYNTHTGQYFQSINVLEVDNIHLISMSTYAFESTRKQAFITHSELHCFNTKNKDNPTLPFIHLTNSQKAHIDLFIRSYQKL